MKLGILLGGEKVVMEVSKQESSKSFETRVCSIADKNDLMAMQKLTDRFPDYEFAFLEPIMENGVYVDFSSKEVTKNLIQTRDMTPYAWKNVAVFNIKLPAYGRVLAVASAGSDVPYNRRGSYRVRIAKPGEVYLNGDANGRSVIVNDISATGIGLIVSDTEGFTKNTPLSVKFFDENNFKVKASVRRVHELSPERCVIGCEFDKFSDSVAQFVNMKQVKQRRAMQEKEQRGK